MNNQRILLKVAIRKESERREGTGGGVVAVVLAAGARRKKGEKPTRLTTTQVELWKCTLYKYLFTLVGFVRTILIG